MYYKKVRINLLLILNYGSDGDDGVKHRISVYTKKIVNKLQLLAIY